MTVKLNAQYFENQGRQYALADMNESIELAKLNRAPIATGSWQRKAWDRGYESGLAQKNIPLAPAASLDAMATVCITAPISHTGHAVSNHIEALLEMARVETDAKRCSRLRAKADKLSIKWFY